MSVHSKASLFLGVGLLVMATGSIAGELYADVEPLARSVSHSVIGSQPVAAYTVFLRNDSNSNTIRNVRFVATTSVCTSATVPGEGQLPAACDVSSSLKATFKSAKLPESTQFPDGEDVNCLVNADFTRVDCSLGALEVGDDTEFTLTFNSPTDGARLDLQWDAVFDSGTPPGGSNGDSGTELIALTPISAATVKSAVPPNEEVEVFTGNRALPSNLDQFTVAIAVPKISVAATAEVIESDAPSDANCKTYRNFLKCNASTITVAKITDGESVNLAGTGSYLTFLLTVDKSNIRGGARIDRVLIQYDDPTVGFVTVLPCGFDDAGFKTPNNNGTPCIKEANDFTKKRSSQGWFGFQWELISYKNGRFSLY